MKHIWQQDIDTALRIVWHGLLSGLFEQVDAGIEKIRALVPKTRKSHPLSKLLRPVLQHKQVQAMIGVQLAGAVMLVSTASAAPGPFETFPEAEVSVISEPLVVATTNERFGVPVNVIGVSQGYHRFHRGVDLRAPLGDLIYPVAEGRVTEVVKGRFGYGHYVLIEHEDGYASLYAHMGKVAVKLGQEVGQETALGRVGMTGWTTGSHLHLEMYHNGTAINPRQVLSV
jgi:murein DD-endopeptidase MepM/ murein hydrolase activator NlpD